MPLTLEEGASASPIDLKLLEDKVQKGGPDSWQLEGGANAAWVNPFWVSHEVPCLILSRTEMMLKTDCSVPINFMACQVNLLPWNYKRALSSQLLLRKNAIHFLMGGRYVKPAGIGRFGEECAEKGFSGGGSLVFPAEYLQGRSPGETH